jgi:putative hydrolase of the HAD superfamily
MPNLCLVFDIDDTLYLERDYALSGFRAVGKWADRNAGLRGFGDAATHLFNRGAKGSIFQEAYRELGREPAAGAIEEMIAVYRGHVPDISLLPDARQCLDRFQDKALIAVVTDGPAISQRRKYDRLELNKFCTVAVFTGEWGTEYSKPHLRSFRSIEQQAGKGEHQFVYVADNPAKDFIGPNSLGWDTIRVRRPGGLHFSEEAEASAKAGLELKDLSGLGEALGRRVLQPR